MAILNEDVKELYDRYLQRLYAEWSKSNSGNFDAFVDETKFNNKKLLELLDALDFNMDPLILEYGAGSKDSLCEHMGNKRNIYLVSPYVIAEDCLNAGIVNCANGEFDSDARWEQFKLSLTNDNRREYIKNGANEHLRPEAELALPFTYVFPSLQDFGTLIAGGVGSVHLDTRFGITNYVNMFCSAIENNQNCFMGYCGDRDNGLTKKALNIYKSIREDIIMKSNVDIRVETASNIGMAYCYMMRKSS